MQLAVFRAAAAELARGISTAVTVWAGTQPCHPCHPCPSNICQPTLVCGARGEEVIEVSTRSHSSPWLVGLIGFVLGVFACLSVLGAFSKNFSDGGSPRSDSGRPSLPAAAPGSPTGGVGVYPLRRSRASGLASESEAGGLSGVLGD